MATHGAILRPSAVLSAATAAAERARFHARSARRAITRFARPGAFSLPSNRSAAASRISRNLAAFRIHYALLLWFSLLIFLCPSHRATMLFLMLISKVILSYAVLLRLFPNSALLHRILVPRIVAGIFVVFVIIQLALASAIVNLFLAIAAVSPIVVAHAIFRTPDASLAAGAGENGKVAGEMVPISEKKDADLESAGVQCSDRSA
ncbi:PRA1 family protein B3 [Dendrobium catenatum]|uniref:PRA1 family protein n=1 Tax=Dendrobium catenatum TaxID=906689 RepID=A0A2I0WXS9_9ASPA|nr:PRA1 family protein B3 [Dendrobium catenatum]PKU80468.1 hypothetical protein MA16_Dca026257 [Dendrobium catenatum]